MGPYLILFFCNGDFIARPDSFFVMVLHLDPIEKRIRPLLVYVYNLKMGDYDHMMRSNPRVLGFKYHCTVDGPSDINFLQSYSSCCSDVLTTYIGS
jgi:hypothetical protein